MSPPTTFDAQKKDKWLRFIQQMSPEADPARIRLMGQLRMAAHTLHQVSELSLTAARLSYAQYRLLLALLYSEQIESRPALTPSQLSRLQGTGRNTISALIRHLESDGLIVRELDPQDRRKFNIHLSEAGRQLMQQHARNHMHTLNNALAVLEASEIETLNRLLEKLNEAIYASAQRVP